MSKRTKPIRRDIPTPQPPNLERHVEELDLDEVWALLNPQVLFGKHLGLRGSVRKLSQAQDQKYLKLRLFVDEIMDEARVEAMTARAVWRFFPASTLGNVLTLKEPETGEIAATWNLPRQKAGSGLCLTDYVLDDDHVALFVTTAGAGIRTRVTQLREAGDYLKSHVLAVLAIETAEAAAELLHARLRTMWGFPDPPEVTVQDILASRYRGKRYSFGYPACPDLAHQHTLFSALDPAEIGVALTEGDMMDPEASVSALVFQHPDATYFRV